MDAGAAESRASPKLPIQGPSSDHQLSEHPEEQSQLLPWVGRCLWDCAPFSGLHYPSTAGVGLLTAGPGGRVAYALLGTQLPTLLPGLASCEVLDLEESWSTGPGQATNMLGASPHSFQIILGSPACFSVDTGLGAG